MQGVAHHIYSSQNDNQYPNFQLQKRIIGEASKHSLKRVLFLSIRMMVRSTLLINSNSHI